MVSGVVVYPHIVGVWAESAALCAREPGWRDVGGSHCGGSVSRPVGRGLLVSAATALLVADVVGGAAVLYYPFFFPLVEERVHFIVFGLFGFVSMVVFPPRVAWVVCLAMAGGDELLQWWLPDRVGDWRDVAVNSVAGVGGLMLAWSGRKRGG